MILYLIFCVFEQLIKTFEHLWNSAVIFTYFLFHLLLTTIATTIYCHLRIVGDWRKCSYFLKPCINYVFQVSLSSISKKEKEEWDSYKRLCHI